MANFVLILLCLVAGFGLRRRGRFTAGSAHALNVFVIYLAFPALVLQQVPELLGATGFGVDLLIPVSMAWIQFILAFAIFYPLGEKLGWKRSATGAVILTAGLGNTSFVGFPVLEALLGPESLRSAILTDQAGSFLTLSTLGLVCASYFSGVSASLGSVIKRIVSFPPFLALVTAALLFATGLSIPADLTKMLEKLSSTLVPLALVSVGIQLDVKPALIRKRLAPLGLGLLYKLILIPLVLTIFYVGVLASHSSATQVAILESAMAPMITAAIVAAEFDLDTEIANLMVGVGIPLSLVSVYVWHLLTRSLFT